MEVLAALLRRDARLEQKDKDGNTALHCAASHNAPNAIATLVATKADLRIRNGQGKTPLRLAVAMGQSAAMQVLSRASGAASPTSPSPSRSPEASSPAVQPTAEDDAVEYEGAEEVDVVLARAKALLSRGDASPPAPIGGEASIKRKQRAAELQRRIRADSPSPQASQNLPSSSSSPPLVEASSPQPRGAATKIAVQMAEIDALPQRLATSQAEAHDLLACNEALQDQVTQLRRSLEAERERRREAEQLVARFVEALRTGDLNSMKGAANSAAKLGLQYGGDVMEANSHAKGKSGESTRYAGL